jgi:hypothetical protein
LYILFLLIYNELGITPSCSNKKRRLPISTKSGVVEITFTDKTTLYA